MYIRAIISTIVAWFVGLLIDANVNFNPKGFLCLRVVLPILIMGYFILYAIKKIADK